MEGLAQALQTAIRDAGFISNVRLIMPKTAKPDQSDLRSIVRAIRSAGKPKRVSVPSIGLKIGLHMCSFRINPEVHGYNGRIDRYSKTVAGYKRTAVPTWNQREDFNHLINEVFDTWKLSAVIKSGPYTVRTKSGAVTNWNPIGQGFHGYQSEIMPESEARDCCDSDRLENEARLKRNETARLKRIQLKGSKS